MSPLSLESVTVMSFISWFRSKKVPISDKEITQGELLDKVAEINLKNAKELGTDLVQASYHLGCCSECAKYRGRVFSISGKDKRFPKMPRNYGCTCQGITFSPFIYGIDKLTVGDFDVIEYSNRPFIDDRTPKELEEYNYFVSEESIEEWYEPYRLRLNKIKDKSRNQYSWVCKNLPELAPKSMGGFTRMKNSNSKNFQRLSDEAMKYGVDLHYTDEELRELNELEPYTQRYAKVKGECLAHRYNYNFKK